MPDNIYLLSDVIIKIFHYLIYDQIYTILRKQRGTVCKYPNFPDIFSKYGEEKKFLIFQYKGLILQWHYLQTTKQTVIIAQKADNAALVEKNLWKLSGMPKKRT